MPTKTLGRGAKPRSKVEVSFLVSHPCGKSYISHARTTGKGSVTETSRKGLGMLSLATTFLNSSEVGTGAEPWAEPPSRIYYLEHNCNKAPWRAAQELPARLGKDAIETPPLLDLRHDGPHSCGAGA